MTDGGYLIGARQPGVDQRYLDDSGGTRPTGWVGWILFAGSMLFLIGTYQVIAGLVALFDDGYWAVTSKGLVLDMSYTAWGWTHIVLGVLALATGTGMMLGQTWARVVGIGIAFLSALAALGFLGASPVWSLLLITFDVLVIYALCVHGRELQSNA